MQYMFWLYLLGLTTFLAIVVRRLVRRQKPLIDDLYAKRLAIEHVHDGVAWVTPAGRIGYLNPALARMLDVTAEQLQGRPWFEMFTPAERGRMQQAYSQMLLAGKATLDARMVDSRGTVSVRGLLIVAVHDHKMRLAGHHCILNDEAKEERAEGQLAYAVNG
jgi:PAS domain S-box-containing protein